jgi:hypothetical protein
VAHRIIVFRVSKEFLSQINDYCSKEKISYSELFDRAIDHLCKKYLEGEYERENGGREDRNSSQEFEVSEA